MEINIWIYVGECIDKTCLFLMITKDVGYRGIHINIYIRICKDIWKYVCVRVCVCVYVFQIELKISVYAVFYEVLFCL